MNLSDYVEQLLQDVILESDTQEQLYEDTFFQKVCDQLTEAGDLESFERAHYWSPTRGIRVDGYGGDPSDNNGILDLVLLDFSVSPEPDKLTKTEMDKLFNRVSKFLQFSRNKKWRDELEETSPAFGLADLISHRWKYILKIRLFLISNRVLSERVSGRIPEILDNREITYSVWDVKRLHSFATSSASREDMEIDLVNDFGEPIPVLQANNSEDQLESYLAIVPGRVLANIYDRWGTRLLEQNVRVFLQARGNVNKGIRRTLEREPSMFLAYNNGITATAESVDLSIREGQLFLRRLKNFQIVNGGQTTASVHLASLDKLDISRTYIQMKLSVVSPEMVTHLVPKISEYANSQNRVSAADFFSNHPFHVRIEEFSRRIYVPSKDGAFYQSKWFYERARGQYADARAGLTRTQRKKFDLEYPRAQMITKTDLAKYIRVWEFLPHEVSLGAQKNFAFFAKRLGQAWKKSPNDFNQAWYRHVIAKAIVFKKTERIVSNGTWYQGGYRANIVAYTIAKIAYDVLERDTHIDFEFIWQRQDLGPELEKLISSVGECVQNILLNPAMSIRNVSEWSKKEICWQKVRETTVDQLPLSCDELISIDKQNERKIEARADQRQLNRISALTTVVEKGGEFWENALKWGISHGFLTTTQRQILEVATLRNGKVPSDKQAIKAIEALEELQIEGYPESLD